LRLIPVDTVDEGIMWETWLSRTWFPTLLAADDLGFFATLHDSPATAVELARALGLNASVVRSVLVLLAARGFLHACRGTYSLTELARAHLLSDSPFYWGGVFSQSRGFDPVAARIRKVLLDNTNGSWGEDWSSATLTQRKATEIASFMHSHSVGAAARVAATGRFSGIKRLLDVGGGSGCYSIALARRYPDLACTILDLPPACHVASRYVADAGLSERIDTRGADMFKEEWPQGYDAILLSNILHDWPPPKQAGLLKQASRALRMGGNIFVHEALLDDDGNGPLTVASFSVLVMLGTPGGQLDHHELQKLLTGSGFADIQSSYIPPLYSLVQAQK
jgi:acetylserotonin N-methyltransferase